MATFLVDMKFQSKELWLLFITLTVPMVLTFGLELLGFDSSSLKDPLSLFALVFLIIGAVFLIFYARFREINSELDELKIGQKKKFRKA